MRPLCAYTATAVRRRPARAGRHRISAGPVPVVAGSARDRAWCGGGAESALAADYVASHYQDEVARSWPGVVEDVRQDVQAVIDREGAFITYGDLAAFVCR